MSSGFVTKAASQLLRMLHNLVSFGRKHFVLLVASATILTGVWKSNIRCAHPPDYTCRYICDQSSHPCKLMEKLLGLGGKAMAEMVDPMAEMVDPIAFSQLPTGMPTFMQLGTAQRH